VSLAFLALVASQMLDFGTFRLMVGGHGWTAEANPLVADLYVQLGTPGVLMLKVWLIVLIGALALMGALDSDRRRAAIVGGMPIALAIAAGIIGGITNTAVVLG